MRRDFDLQLFAEERTEPATPRRRLVARQKGQIAFSQDLSSAAGFLGAVLAFRVSLDPVARFLLARSSAIWSHMSSNEPTLGWAQGVFRTVLVMAGAASMPVMLSAAVLAAAAALCQTGLVFRPAALSPDFSRLNPAAGLTRMFSRRSLAHCVRALAKVAIMSGVAWSIMRKAWPEMSSLLARDLTDSIAVAGNAISRLAFSGAILMVLAGIFDYVYQRWEHEKSLRMTHKELRDEIRESEVKPEIKSQIRARQRQMARMRMMQDVPSADVVVTNPDHYSVALRYNAGKDPAPVVVAKGVNEVALRIREVAADHGVRMVQNPPLAQSLYRVVDIGEVIPEELYRAVAEVLAYVYKLSGRTPEKGGAH